MIKLLFFSFRLILATTQPSAQDSVSTKMLISKSSRIEPAITPRLAETVIQYTITAGRMTTPEYISPSR